MTSQIVLINQAGVAVASDTMTSKSAQGGGSKTYPTANKIYELGPDHQVVVLHSGATMLDQLTYDLLVREWSLTLDGRLPALSDYPRAFETWVRNFRLLEIDEARLVSQLLHDSLENFLRGSEWLGLVTSGGHLKDLPDDLQEQLRTALEDRAERYVVAESDLIPGLSEEAIRSALVEGRWNGLWENFLDAIHHVTDARPEWPDAGKAKNALIEYAVKRLMYYCNSSFSGELAWIGFGSEEPIGGVIRVRINGYYLGGLQAVAEQREPEAREPRVHVATIAQTDAIDDFLFGLSVHRWSAVTRMAGQALKETVESLTDEQAKAFDNKFAPELGNYMSTMFKEPALASLGALSVSSLVSFAESLVNVQRLRASVSNFEATVGGLIESVSITRREGVTWHARLTNSDHGGAPHSVHPLT